MARRALLQASALYWIGSGLPAWSADAARPPALMLAQVHSSRHPLAGHWVSEKYDGVRGYWDGQQLRTRGGHTIAAPAWFTAGWPTQPLDGELWVGRGQFAQAVATVRDQRPDETAWRAVRYMVFDLPAHDGSFDERIPALQAAVQQIAQPWVQAVVQTPATDAAALQHLLALTVRAGGEGLMLHQGSARYTTQRTDALRKLKPHADAEARVVSQMPGQGKYAGRMGALWLERPALDGQPAQRFKLGTGFSDAERAAPPPVGSWVTYRYRGLTDKGVPRFASFLRVAPEPGF
ncbi:MAG: DNA ligase [Burkholderiaceae bacterium]|nr:DNA ligase [Burkholderiaceae bacterium]